MDAGDRSRAVVVLVLGRGAEVDLARVDGLLDLALVDVLARLQLSVRRLGWSIRLHDPCESLCELLELVGLADVLGARCELPVEAGGQAEGFEELGVEEVVQRRDPTV